MSPESAQYTLVGFSPELDWRPLSFVRPLPPNRVCGACGLVRKKTAFLPCIHVLCKCCYEQSEQEGSHVCPLDGYVCQDEDVEWRDCPVEELLRRKVVCWNKDCGCDTVTVASEIFAHFQRECGHHSVSCPKCSTRILCSGVSSHLRSNCCSQAKCLESEDQEPLGCKDGKEYLASFRAAFEKQAMEIRAVLQETVVGSAMHDERLNEICQSIITFKEIVEKQLAAHTKQNQDILIKSIHDHRGFFQEAEKTSSTHTAGLCVISRSIDGFEKALKDEVANGTSRARDHFTQTAAAIKADLKQDNKKALDNIREVLQCVQLLVTVVNFTVPGVQALQERVLKEGSSMYESGHVYLRGYHLSPGIYLEKDGESLKLCALMSLLKGDMDDFVHWPFQHKVKLSIVHPKHGSKREYVGEPRLSAEFYQKPSESKNRGVYFIENCLRLNDLLTGGYVETDNLRAQFELLP